MENNSVERREFYRLAYEKPVKFIQVSSDSGKEGVLRAVSKNISQSGILFISKFFPKISSVIWINLPLKELAICKEIEERAITVKNGMLGRVVRVEENAQSGGYSVGVCFLKKGDSDTVSITSKVEKVLASGK
ncbi:MAG: hypothetical protein AUJ75_01835 [Candidatus Omnitrophica bacterium CG1_02_49_10]|nr:MAG: hypothetical protein AUJ75_01835 [Candidatus Omnitrophica bacterium CG1_02_49_10]